MTYLAGDTVWYLRGDGTWTKATIRLVHAHHSPASYTIVLDGTAIERNTEANRLRRFHQPVATVQAAWASATQGAQRVKTSVKTAWWRLRWYHCCAVGLLLLTAWVSQAPAIGRSGVSDLLRQVQDESQGTADRELAALTLWLCQTKQPSCRSQLLEEDRGMWLALLTSSNSSVLTEVAAKMVYSLSSMHSTPGAGSQPNASIANPRGQEMQEMDLILLSSKLQQQACGHVCQEVIILTLSTAATQPGQLHKLTTVDNLVPPLLNWAGLWPPGTPIPNVNSSTGLVAAHLVSNLALLPSAHRQLPASQLTHFPAILRGTDPEAGLRPAHAKAVAARVLANLAASQARGGWLLDGAALQEHISALQMLLQQGTAEEQVASALALENAAASSKHARKQLLSGNMQAVLLGVASDSRSTAVQMAALHAVLNLVNDGGMAMALPSSDQLSRATSTLTADLVPVQVLNVLQGRLSRAKQLGGAALSWPVMRGITLCGQAGCFAVHHNLQQLRGAHQAPDAITAEAQHLAVLPTAMAAHSCNAVAAAVAGMAPTDAKGGQLQHISCYSVHAGTGQETVAWTVSRLSDPVRIPAMQLPGFDWMTTHAFWDLANHGGAARGATIRAWRTLLATASAQLWEARMRPLVISTWNNLACVAKVTWQSALAPACRRFATCLDVAGRAFWRVSEPVWLSVCAGCASVRDTVLLPVADALSTAVVASAATVWQVCHVWVIMPLLAVGEAAWHMVVAGVLALAHRTGAFLWACILVPIWEVAIAPLLSLLAGAVTMVLMGLGIMCTLVVACKAMLSKIGIRL